MSAWPLVATGTATLVAAASQPVVGRYLHRRRILDIPNERSSHSAPTPRGGGIGVALGMASAAAVWAIGPGLPLPAAHVVAVGGACLAMFAVGLLDDVHTVAAPARLAAQLTTGVVAALFLGLPYWVVVAAAVWFAGVVNTVNFMDGINGISAGVGIIGGTWFAWIGLTDDAQLLTLLGLAIAGSCLGFLPFNVPNARLFLGDSGSYLLGGGLATASVLAWTEGASVMVAAAPLLIYLADTGTTLLRRLRRRQPLFTAHRDHVYQRLTRTGLSHSAVAVIVAGASAACCLASVALTPLAALVVLGCVIPAYLLAPTARARLALAHQRVS